MKDWREVMRYWVLGAFYIGASVLVIWSCAGFEVEIDKARVVVGGGEVEEEEDTEE